MCFMFTRYFEPELTKLYLIYKQCRRKCSHIGANQLTVFRSNLFVFLTGTSEYNKMPFQILHTCCLYEE